MAQPVTSPLTPSRQNIQVDKASSSEGPRGFRGLRELYDVTEEAEVKRVDNQTVSATCVEIVQILVDNTPPGSNSPTPRKVPTSDLFSSLNSPIYSHLSNSGRRRAHLKERAAAAMPLQGTCSRRRPAHFKERDAAAGTPTSRNCRRLHRVHAHTLFSPLSTLRDAAAAAPPQGTRPVTVDGYNEEK
ncbi:hypothetical protein Salat_1442500 [Sesamum alatum]|uniref:Uncharacterized protein n=1 Tax=Sesamum alatum TaxID=300844 RepID=A0AAE2CLQ3_9LAMI|nr:hypothetical protein Salat_1442500 [Sesamum alatum]